MAYTCTLTVLDEDSGNTVEHTLSPEEAVGVLAIAPQAAKLRANAAEEEDTDTEDEEESEEARPLTRKRAARTCSLCGKPGHSKRTCSDLKRPTPTTTEPPPPSDATLTEDQFDELKHQQEIGDLSSHDFAKKHGIAVAQVNRAIASETYEDYLNF